MSKTSLLGLLFVLFSNHTFAQAPEASSGNKLVCGELPALMLRLLSNHVSPGTPEARAERVVKLYLDRLDPSRSLLLASEAAAIGQRVHRALDELMLRKCDTLFELNEQLLVRHRETEAYVRKLVSAPGFELDRSVELTLDPEKRERPKTNAERDELRRKMVHFQLANYVTAGTKLAEAKPKLIHRYELISKRMKELKQPDHLAVFLDTYASALDPHTNYLSADDLEDFSIGMRLSLDGIGAVLSSKDGYTTIEEIVPGGPADRQGELKTKDRIVAVAQGDSKETVDVIDMGLRDVVRLIRGKKGSKVRLTILRQGERTETRNISVVRDKIDLKEQAAKLTFETVKVGERAVKLAVLELPSFYGGQGADARQCNDDVAKLLEEATAKGAEGLLLDLSRNGGGILQYAVDITGYFLKQGPVVAVEGPILPRQILEDEDTRILFKGPMVILTSRISASASEIVAGALRDYGRALIVGDRQTFGKGSVQNLIDLPDGFGALKVTTAKFFRPGGQSTQNLGVPAHIVLPSLTDQDDLGEQFVPFALPPAKTKPFAGTEINDAQPKSAFQALTDAEVRRLGRCSAARVARSAAFAEVEKDVEKVRKNRGVVRVGELLDEGKNPEEDEEKDKKGELSAQAREALSILADMATGACQSSDGAQAKAKP